MPGIPDTFAGAVLDFITNRQPYVWTPASLGTVTVSLATPALFTVSAAHGLAVNEAVVLGTMTTGAPFIAGTSYFVASVPTTTTLTLAATLGGVAIASTTAGSSVSITRVSGNTYAGGTYLALLNADPGTDAVMASLPEIADVGYARQIVAFAVPSAAPRGTSNAALFTFGPFTAGMAVGATYAAVVEAASGLTGKVRYVWALDTVLVAASGESVQFPVASLTLGW